MKSKSNILFLFAILYGMTFQAKAQSDYKLAEQDSLALVAFYWATDGPNWVSNQPGFGFDDLSSEWQITYDGNYNNWFDGPVKDWFGVRVETRGVPNSVDSIGRVTWLWPVIGRRTDGQNLLQGYVPREVGLMTALEHFRVNGNDGFKGELMPDEIYQPSLQYLDPEACMFDGDVSDAFRNCLNIRKFNLRYNDFDYIPNLDFLDEEALRKLEGTQWLYNSRFSYFYLERIIDHFYTISPNPMEFRLEMRDMFDVGDEIEIVAPLGSPIELTCNDAGQKEEFITYQWFKNGLSLFGKDEKTLVIPNVTASNYGDYTVRITNDYVKSYDINGNYGEVFTKEIHLIEAPTAPVINKAVSTYNGQAIELYFSKPMSNTDLGSYENLTVTANGNNIEVTGAAVMGRIDKLVRIQLATPISEGEEIQLSLSEGVILDQNSGQMELLNDFSVINRVRPAPQIVTAATTLDGSGITLEFDQYINSNSLPSSTFEVLGDKLYEVEATSLVNGNVDQHISKTVLLTLTESIVDTTEVITVAYVGGSIHGLYGGTVEYTGPIDVLNQVSVDRTDVLITFEDGTASLENIYLQGSWSPTPVAMYDNGDDGDVAANDHTWTYNLPLVDDNYTWDILLRTEEQVNDTITTVDPNTGVITLTIVPSTVARDSIISNNIVLDFSVVGEDITGDTNYGVENLEVIFNVQTTGNTDEIHLMGLDDDWAEGILMQTVTEGSLYSHTLLRQTAGKVLRYNYRIGNDWENNNPEPRQHIIKNGLNIINDSFGVFTDVEDLNVLPLKVYPNPSFNGLVTIESEESFIQIDVFNLAGQLVQTISKHTNNLITLDLSNQEKGLYLLKAVSDRGQIYSSKIILQ